MSGDDSDEESESIDQNIVHGSYKWATSALSIIKREQFSPIRKLNVRRVNITSKPDKYGIKVVCMCDTRTYYMVSAKPLMGKENRENKEPSSSHLVKKLSTSIHGTNRNLTMDN
nr:unnamed protein product [Callosobruchus analis]